ncbi:hypothetical protein CcaverHIS002_0310180 [Cutaneotrichosporon cavernicola]|uniref:F-box domain-containing protein n=1 Tax=Cutaneotrichosporon cavernicola TaxID=279322 RepID=A0AA48IJ45_9TREE|nr:uncharacterized protein CcaverHIS019_0310030 [Cutaneotrichosporon cavernicola]BEI83150.1 hypothetical protein CcaverHIS002_0310180 [Cutaneotrichosporon cavernicola]BEI90933.1 hypothetical protein CcaverHIS019_0310030 [Cutaneotrichosporon cavernicola]BEI98712.1 hypothetical protein CcaverHIS631_0310110 [Cutaneotrichosporon cavernicola]BEJ06483.1 hypothetical protein CcaverHIS641_0310050 [Cutaneotrichosporon cavernicola]
MTKSFLELRRQLLGLSPDDRRDLVTELLWSLPRQDVLRIHSRISDMMQKDIVGLLPPEISVRILSQLSADDLLRCKAVSRAWSKLCDDQAIWICLCARNTPAIVPQHTTWNDLECHRQRARAASPNASRLYGDESFEYADDGDSHIMAMTPSPSARRTVWERNSSGLPTYQRAVAFSPPPAAPTGTAPEPVIPSHLGLPTAFPRVSYKHLYLVRRILARRMTYLRPADLETPGRRSGTSWNPRVVIINPTSSQEHGGLPGHTESIYSLHLIKRHMNISCRIGEVDDALYSLLAPVSNDIFGSTASPSRSGLGASPVRSSTSSSFHVSGRDWLLSASRDKTMRLWQLSPTPRVVKVFAGGHTGSILTHFVAEIPVEDSSSRSPLGSYSGARSPPKSPSPMRDSPKTRLVAISGGGDGKICLWDIEHGDGTPEKTIQAHSDSVFFLRGDDEKVVSCSKDRTIRVFDIRTLEELVVIEDTSDGHRGAINAVDITKEFIVSASGDRTIKVWDINDGRLRASLDAHVRGITSMAFEPYSSSLAGWKPEVPGSVLCATLVTGSSDASIKTFHVVQLPPSAELDEVTFRDMLDLDADEPRVRYAIQPGVEYHAVCACPVPTRPSPSGCMRCFNRGHTELVRSLYLGDQVTLSASYDKTIKMWERSTGRLIFDFSGCHKGSVFAITGDHTRVVSSGIDAKIAIVDFADGLDTAFV